MGRSAFFLSMASPKMRMSSRHSRMSEVFTVCGALGTDACFIYVPPPLFGSVSCTRIGFCFAVDNSVPFSVRVRKLNIPRTPDRRITHPFESIRCGIRPTDLPAILAHIAVPLLILQIIRGTVAQEQLGDGYDRATSGLEV